MRKSKLGKLPKINVIPVLDAVFIFVFFLLMSAQFVDLYELHVKKPLIEEVTSSEAKSKSFKVRVFQSKIVITQGMNERVVGTFNWSEGSMKKLGERLLALKVQNPKENSIVIRPKSNVKYKKIVQVIDLAQKHYATQNINGKLFSSIAFEPMD